MHNIFVIFYFQPFSLLSLAIHLANKWSLEGILHAAQRENLSRKFMIMRRYKITEDCIKSCHEHFHVVPSSQAKQLKEEKFFLSSTQHATPLLSHHPRLFSCFTFSMQKYFHFFPPLTTATQWILLIKNFLCNYNINLLEKYARGWSEFDFLPLHSFKVARLKKFQLQILFNDQKTLILMCF